MLEQIPIEFESYLLSIFNEIFSKVFPHSWKSSLVMLISKPGLKRSNSFRLCRHTYVSWSVSYTEDWTGTLNSGPFCHNHNRISDLLKPMTIIWPLTSVRTGFLNQSPMATIFLDIAGAFDNVDSYILLEDLREIGIPALSRKFVENLISVRHLNFDILIIDGELCMDHITLIRTHRESTYMPILYLKTCGSRFHQVTAITIQGNQEGNGIPHFNTNKYYTRWSQGI